jgi:hypothetical protein
MKTPVSLPDRFGPQLVNLPESGMGYWIADIKTKNGEVFRGVVIVGGVIVSVDRKQEVPFDPEEIVSFKITHDKSAIVR